MISLTDKLKEAYENAPKSENKSPKYTPEEEKRIWEEFREKQRQHKIEQAKLRREYSNIIKG